jgi:hypothetical protein
MTYRSRSGSLCSVTDEATARDLPAELCASVERCLEANVPVAGVTRGRGTTNSVDAAGTSLRKDLIASIARRYPGETYAPACLLRDPTNADDANAVRVFVDGYHVGFLKAFDAARWQACLLDCERRDLVLCARATFYGPSRWGIELGVKREPPRSDPEEVVAQVAAGDPIRRELDKITSARLSGAVQKWDLKLSKRGREYRLLPGKPYGHGTRPPLVGWDGRVFTLEELEDLLATAEESFAATHGFEIDP